MRHSDRQCKGSITSGRTRFHHEMRVDLNWMLKRSPPPREGPQNLSDLLGIGQPWNHEDANPSAVGPYKNCIIRTLNVCLVELQNSTSQNIKECLKFTRDYSVRNCTRDYLVMGHFARAIVSGSILSYIRSPHPYLSLAQAGRGCLCVNCANRISLLG